MSNAIKIYDLDRAIPVRSISVPDARQLNDVAFASDGRLYATVSAAGAVSRIDPVTATVTAPVKPAGAPGANGIATAPDGLRVSEVQTLQSHRHPAILERTTATIAPDGLYLLTRTNVTRFGDQGTLDRPDTVQPAVILRVPLSRG